MPLFMSWIHLTQVNRLTTFLLKLSYCLMTMKRAIYYEAESWTSRCYKMLHSPFCLCFYAFLYLIRVVFFFFTESVMPSSGIFVVKLPNHPRNLGLTIKGDAFWELFPLSELLPSYLFETKTQNFLLIWCLTYKDCKLT